MTTFFAYSHAMRNLMLGLVACLVLLTVAAQHAAARSKPEAPRSETRYIVLYENSIKKSDVPSETNRLEERHGFRSDLRFRHTVRGFAARLSRSDVEELRQDDEVDLVTRDRPVEVAGFVPLASGEPTPPPGVRRIGAASSTTARQESAADVAVIDTGVDLAHPDLDAANGIDCIAPGTSADDDNGHGTHVAGTIGAKNNGSGVVGVTPATTVWAVKVLDSEGSGFYSNIVCGIEWVTANARQVGIKVANMSLGGLGENDHSCGNTNGDILHQAICLSTNISGVTYVVAAGNDGWDIGDDPPDTPSSYPEVLTVSAMADANGTGGGGGTLSCSSAPDDRYASFSNYATRSRDTAHMIAAPGVCIRSTWPGGTYATLSGTSMATPHVAGAVSLCYQEGDQAGPCAGMSPAEVIGYMRFVAYQRRSQFPSSGYSGDPWSAAGAKYYGFLVRANSPYDPAAPVVVTPGSLVRISGTDRSGGVANIGADDNRYYQLNSTTSSTRTASWYGRIVRVPNELMSLQLAYRGKSSRSCKQTLYLYNWTAGKWTALDSRSVSSSELSVAKAAPGTLSAYVSGDSGEGEVRARVHCTTTAGSFYLSAEELKITYKRG